VITPTGDAQATQGSDVSSHAAAFSDAIQALMTLGYKIDAADQAIRKASQALGSDATADALIKLALKSS
jgi:Holliday junction resolvasome RuvABC DNA-binding subunit